MESKGRKSSIPTECFIPLDLAEISRIRQKVPTKCQPKRVTYSTGFSRFLPKFNFFKAPKRSSHSEATSDFIFYTNSSKDPVLSNRASVISSQPPNNNKYGQCQGDANSVPYCSTLNCIKTGLITTWILFTAFVITYTGVRCHQKEGCGFLFTEIEGFFLLCFMFAVLLVAVILIYLFQKQGKADSCFVIETPL